MRVYIADFVYFDEHEHIRSTRIVFDSLDNESAIEDTIRTYRYRKNYNPSIRISSLKLTGNLVRKISEIGVCRTSREVIFDKKGHELKEYMKSLIVA